MRIAMNDQFVLIISDVDDVHADRVQKILSGGKFGVVRINSSALSKHSYLAFSDELLSDELPFWVVHKGKNISFKDVRSIWLRKPFNPQITEARFKPSLDQIYNRQYAHNEFKELYLAYILEAAKHNVFVLDNNIRRNIAERKCLQLIAARKVGLSVPNSLVTSNLGEVDKFIQRNNDIAIIKPLSTGTLEYGDKLLQCGTYELAYDKFLEFKKRVKTIDYPFFIQEKVEKVFELRITIMGNQMFACSIDSQADEAAKLDWRRVLPFKLKHEIYKLPSEIEAKCFNLVKALGLQFGAIDMAVTPEGKYVFFEINPNGQYLWIEEMAGLPLSQAMANLLSEPEKYKLR
jgi:glutathione synthase/RimK-type ligase-like ATP-grasp enzyme